MTGVAHIPVIQRKSLLVMVVLEPDIKKPGIDRAHYLVRVHLPPQVVSGGLISVRSCIPPAPGGYQIYTDQP